MFGKLNITLSLIYIFHILIHIHTLYSVTVVIIDQNKQYIYGFNKNEEDILDQLFSNTVTTQTNNFRENNP